MTEIIGFKIHMEVFLVYNLGTKYHRGDFTTLFSQPLVDIDEHICDKPIFFDENNALNYMRFVDRNHCILRVYLPESAIEGHFDGLYLKKGSLAHTQIHGCYPGYAKGKEYIANEAFDNRLLTLTVGTKEDLL